MSRRKIVCEDLNRGIDDLRRQGFRLDVIYPADGPTSALLSRDGELVQLAIAGAVPPTDALPPFGPASILTRSGASPDAGRAGMLYRDLIPGRLGGRYIASHITIPEGGPVDDWVHHHRVAVQMIVVRRGWVRVVYQDQGDPFVMEAGDLVVQPPGIRHRVLESSTGLEVVEISAPALHETFADHDLALPNGAAAGREYGGQHFLRHVAADIPWRPVEGLEVQETAVASVTGGIAAARTIRPGTASEAGFDGHEGELVFGFVMEGRARMNGAELCPADAFTILPGDAWRIESMTPDFRLLHVTTARLDAVGRSLL